MYVGFSGNNGPQDIMYADGMEIGSWTDFWNRYQMPDTSAQAEVSVEDTSALTGSDEGMSGLGYVNLGANIVTSVASIYSAYNQAKTQKALLKVQGEIAGINQRIAERQAQSALRQSEFKIAAITLRAGQVKSSQKASLAANGIQLGVGSAAELTASTDLMKEIDVNNERLNGIMNAWGYRFKAIGEGSKAAEYRLRADSSNPRIAALGEAGRGLASVGAQAYTYYKNGLLG